MINLFTLAILHHLAAFTLVASIAAELAVFKTPLNAPLARRMLNIDMITGTSAGILLIVGVVRMTYEKGILYYLSNWFFIGKLSLFIIALIISLYPTVIYFAWNRAIRRGQSADLAPEQYKRVRLCLMFELTCIVGILICAPLMARGVGYFGG